MNNNSKLKKKAVTSTLLIYIAAALTMFVFTKYLIPYLSESTGLETVFYWFVVAGAGIFLPLILLGLILLNKEGMPWDRQTWKQRLRFKKMTKKDWQWGIGSLLLIGLLSFLIMEGLVVLLGEFDHTPSFMTFEPLSQGRYWLLLVWVPYWLANIFGEEFIWRGVLLPRQEVAFGKYAWMINSLGWGLFHIAFGWQLLITLIPILVILPYVVHKTKNSWTGILIHGGLNGPSFIAICFGLI